MKNKVYLIANAHIDPIWQWEEDEGIFSALSTYRSAINLLDEFDFIFCHNEAYVYEQIERIDKKLFEDIKAAVQKGKWIIMGGWYVQPDCLMPKGESIVRQILRGKKYFLEKFGVEPKTAINFDSFGHSRGLVQIIKKCKQNGYIITRPSVNEFEYPNECFHWIGYDDSVIKVYHCSSYSTPLGLAKRFIERDIKAHEKSGNSFIKLWGVGNHGGGPSRKDLHDIEELMRERSDIVLEHSTPDKAIAEISANGEVATSLNNCNVGCYTSESKFKSKYLAVERLYYQVEKMAAVSAGCGAKYPTDELERTLKEILFCEFHDLLPGTSIKRGEENGLSVLGSAEKKLKDLRLAFTNYLCGGEKVAKEGEYPMFVFNDLPHKVCKYVECELCVIPVCGADEETVIHIKDKNGKEILLQTTKPDSNVNMDWRKRIGFYADLEPLTFNRFDVFVAYKKISKEMERVGLKNDFVLENEIGKVVISGRTGGICEYSVNGNKYIHKDAFVLYAYEDNENPWGHKKKRDDIIVKNPKVFSFGGIGIFEDQNSIKIVEDGELFTVVESLYHYKQTQAVVQYKIFKKDLRVQIKIAVVLANKNIMIKAHLPMINKQIFSGQMFGEEIIENTDNECVVQEYLKIPFEKDCLGIAISDTYAVSYDNENLKLNLLRGTTYCAHPIGDRPIVESNRYLQTMDLGLSEFCFTLFVDDFQKISGRQRQMALPYAMQIFPSGEGTPIPFEFKVDNESVLLEAFKKNESGEGYIARLFNSVDDTVRCETEFNGKKLKLNFGKYEVKTIEIHDGLIELCEMKI